MTITWLSLFWLFFFYSFIGWCIEVCAAAVQHRKFVNRGFVAGPLCPIYGFGAMLFEIFLPELTEDPFFLFLGGFVLSFLFLSECENGGLNSFSKLKKPLPARATAFSYFKVLRDERIIPRLRCIYWSPLQALLPS